MAKRIRGNFNPELIKGALRQGDNNVVQMFGGGSAVAGNVLIYDPNGNAIDGGTAPAAGLPTSPSDATKFLNGAATPAYAKVKDSDLAVSNVTTNNVSTSAHGFAPILPNDATKFLNGIGGWTVPAGSGGGGGGSSATVGLYASFPPASPSTGTQYFCTDSPYHFVYNGSAWQAYAFGLPVTVPPSVASFTWVNQLTATADSTPGMFTIQSASAGAASVRMLVKTAPTPPYTWIVGFLYTGQIGNFVHSGMVLRDSGTGKIVTYGPGTSGGTALNLDYWTGPTTFNSVVKEVAFQPFNLMFLKIVDDGTNLTYSVGNTPFTMLQFAQTTRTAFLASPNQVGFCIDPENFAGLLSIFHCTGI